jgi:hypothetical protein
MRAVLAWQAAGGIASGALFRRVWGRAAPAAGSVPSPAGP